MCTITKRVIICLLLLTVTYAGFAQETDWNKLPAGKERLTALQKYGTDCIKKQQFDAAVATFTTGLTLSRQAAMDSFSCSNLLYLSTAYRYKAKFDSALQLLHEAQVIADKKNYTILQALVQIESYGIYNRMGKTDSTAVIILRLKAMLPLLDSNGRERARIEMYLGHNDKHKANYTEALAHYYKALRSFTYLNDSLNEGNIFISLATVLVNLGQDDKALSYHQQAAALFTKMGRRPELATELINLTDMYYTSNRLDSAEVSVQKALAIAQDLHDNVVQAYAYIHLGNINNRRKNFGAAEKYFLQSIQIGEPAGIENALGESYQGLGEMYMAQQQPSKAAPYLAKHFQLAKDDKDNGEIIEATLNIAENEYALHHYDKAYEFQKLYSAYKDTVYTATASKSMAEMESKYQAEKKEKEIVLLKKDQELSRVSLQKQQAFQYGAIALIALLALIGFLVINRYRVVQRSKRLIEMERMRNHIARDLHDDIGSTLTSINIMSKVALQQETGNTAMTANMQKIKERSAAIMESMGDIVWAINPQNDSFEQIVSRMKEFTAEILEPLNIQYQFKEEGDFSNLLLDIQKRKDLYLLFKEAVNNAAKYSQCTNLVVDIRQQAQLLYLAVTDDGIGFDEQRVKHGNGLANMRERAASMGATLITHTEPGKGTSITLQVPLT
jgi:two-component system sensor histidine kinase UhpB